MEAQEGSKGNTHTGDDNQAHMKQITIAQLIKENGYRLQHYITNGRFVGLKVIEVISTNPKYFAKHHKKITTQKL